MEQDSDIRILLVGRTGHGKSSNGNTIVGRNVFEESEESVSKTKTCKWSNKCNRLGKVVEVVDTPGMFDTDLTEVQVQKELLKALALTTPGFHVIAFVLKKGRFTNELQKTRDLFFEWFGKGVEKFACVILTDTDSEEAKQKYIYDKPHQKLAELVHLCNDNVVALNNKGSEKEKDIQITKLFKVVEGIKHTNGDRHLSNVFFQLALSYINSRCPQNLTLDSIRIIEENRQQLCPSQNHLLQTLIMNNDGIKSDISLDSDKNDQSYIDNVIEDNRCAASRNVGNLPIYDNVTNERISNRQVDNSALRERKDITGSDDSSTSKFDDKSSILNTSQNVIEPTTGEMESDEYNDLKNSSDASKMDDDTHRNCQNRTPRQNRKFDIDSVNFVSPPNSNLHNRQNVEDYTAGQKESDKCSDFRYARVALKIDGGTRGHYQKPTPRQSREYESESVRLDPPPNGLDDFKCSINGDKNGNILHGMFKYFKKGWEYCKKKMSGCTLS